MYAGLSTVIVYVCAQKRAKYALGERKLDVNKVRPSPNNQARIKNICEGYVHVKEILSHLLADAEARSLVSDSVP